MKQICAIALALLLGSGAMAQAENCPTRNDLDDGIRLVRNDPFFASVFTRTADGLAEARVMQRDGRAEDVSTVYAHPLAVSRRIGQNGTLELDYAGNTAALDQLDVQTRWSSPFTLSQDGQEILRGEAISSYLGDTTFTVGNCRYAVWIVRSKLLRDDGQMISNFEHLYAPAAGIVLLATKLDGNDQPVSNVLPDLVRAEP